MNETIRISAPAKTNLFLRIVRRRPDGFHDIETLFHPVRNAADVLEISFNDSGCVTLSCSKPGVPCDGSNLCCKAVQAYFRAGTMPVQGMHIALTKNIPVAAGMGGGSSDCAAVLLALERKFGAVGRDRLSALAGEIGSDIPLFLDLCDAVGRGRGERLTAVDHEEHPLPLLFAAPCFPVSAKWAYTHIDYSALKDAPRLEDAVSALRKGDLAELRKNLRNDLETAAFAKFPLLRIIRDTFTESGGIPLLSGSGPTVFALYSGFEERDHAFANLTRVFQSLNIVCFRG